MLSSGNFDGGTSDGNCFLSSLLSLVPKSAFVIKVTRAETNFFLYGMRSHFLTFVLIFDTREKRERERERVEFSKNMDTGTNNDDSIRYDRVEVDADVRISESRWNDVASRARVDLGIEKAFHRLFRSF